MIGLAALVLVILLATAIVLCGFALEHAARAAERQAIVVEETEEYPR